VSEVVSRCSLILALYGRPHSSECGMNEHRDDIAGPQRGDDVAVLVHAAFGGMGPAIEGEDEGDGRDEEAEQRPKPCEASRRAAEGAAGSQILASHGCSPQ